MITDWAIALLLGLGLFAVYVYTLCPTVYIEDSAEFSAVAAIWGIPHPPGYPLYTLLAALFVRVAAFRDIAYRSNLLSAVYGSLSLMAMWHLLRRIKVGRASATAATLFFGLGLTFWSQCLAAEVHTLNCLLLLCAFLGVLDAARRPSSKSFFSAGLLMGLLVGHRNLNAVYAAALIATMEVARSRDQASPKLWGASLAGGLLSGAVYLYLPLAAHFHPGINMGAPTTFSRFYDIITARPYFRHFSAGSAAVDAARISRFVTTLPRELGLAVLAVPFAFTSSAAGVEQRAARWILGWIIITDVAFSALYNVIDIESYFLPSLIGLALLGAIGFQYAGFSYRVFIVILAICMLPLNIARVSLREMPIAETYGRDLLASAPPAAIVVSFADTTTHVLWYKQFVEHARPDLAVVSFSEIDSWYVQEISRRYPSLAWPTAEHELGLHWLSAFVDLNIGARPVCLTEPLDLSLSGHHIHTRGLLFCEEPPDSSANLPATLEFWRTSAIPTLTDLRSADIHAQMIAFSYALARFRFGLELVRAHDTADAKVLLSAVAESNVDAIEANIGAAIATIGRNRRVPFTLGGRARAALTSAAELEATADTAGL